MVSLILYLDLKVTKRVGAVAEIIEMGLNADSDALLVLLKPSY